MTGESLPKTQMEAAASGAVLYFTGRPCKYGHVADRYSANAICAECNRIKSRDRAAKLRATLKAGRAARALAEGSGS